VSPPPSESDYYAKITIAETDLFIENNALWVYNDSRCYEGEPLEQAIPKVQALLAAMRLAANAGLTA
jgi:hypothetical protein